MSITTAALTQMLSNQLSSQENSISQLQTQLASGQQLNLPSDNPAAVTQVLGLSSQASQLTSWQSNAALASTWLSTATSTANDIIESMQSAHTLLLQAANQGAQNSTSYQAIGSQLRGVISNLLSLSNTQFEGRPLFGGTSASAQAYDSSGNYLGNTDVPTVVLGPGPGVGHTVGISVPGPSMFGAGASNVFASLTAVATALQTGAPTTAEISTALTALDANLAIAQQASAIMGTASEQVSGISTALTAQLSNVQANQANLLDINVASTTTQLNAEMANYQAALWAASRAIPETLQQFIAP